MFEQIKEKCKTKEGIMSLSKMELYYAGVWIEKGDIELSEDLTLIFAEEYVMNCE